VAGHHPGERLIGIPLVLSGTFQPAVALPIGAAPRTVLYDGLGRACRTTSAGRRHRPCPWCCEVGRCGRSSATIVSSAAPARSVRLRRLLRLVQWPAVSTSTDIPQGGGPVRAVRVATSSAGMQRAWRPADLLSASPRPALLHDNSQTLAPVRMPERTPSGTCLARRTSSALENVMSCTPDALWDARLAPATCGGPRRHREGSTLCCPPAMVRL
jgi:hypothetical protein